MSPESMRKILDRVSHPILREQLVRAWLSNSLEEDFIGGRGPHTVTMDETNAACLRRIKMQVLQGRLLGAESIAFRRLERTTPGVMYEMLLDQLLLIRARLDEPGRAMEVVRKIAEGAIERAEPRRFIAAQLARIRILSRFTEVPTTQILEILRKTNTVFMNSPEPERRPKYVVAEQTALDLTRLGIIIGYMECRRLVIDKTVLDTLSAEIAHYLSKDIPNPLRSLLFQQSARIWLLKDNTFQAIDALDAAYAASEGDSDTEPEYCAFIAGKIMRETDGSSLAINYLRSVSKHYRSMGDLARMRLVNVELALAENEMFPKSPRF